MKNILVDLTYINPDVMAGVSVYIYRLLSGFAQCHYTENIILLCTHNNIHAIKKETGNSFQLLVFDDINISKIPHIHGMLNLYRMNRLIAKNKIDKFFSPFINIAGLYTSKVPCIGVFHDTQGFKLKHGRLKRLLFKTTLKHILTRQQRLVTISNYVRNDILHKCPYIRVEISVVYNSIPNTQYFQERTVSSSSPYILNVNTLEPYKNIITLIKAFALIKEEISHNLIIKAKRLPYWDEQVLPLIKELGIDGRIKLIDNKYSEAEMHKLYSNASLFVSPSLMEGFGFTPIEAAIHCIPVVCTKETALYETTKGLLNYYEPAMSAEHLSKKMLDVLNTEYEPEYLKNIAKEYIQTYSPQKQAGKFIELFNQ